MAEGQEKAEKDLEKDEMTCIICHQHYTDPKVLPCCHYYCKECIGKLAGSGKPFHCPECRKHITLPEGGVDILPKAFFVNPMKAFHQKLVQAPLKQASEKCEICCVDKPEAFCQQCEKYLCEDCVELYKTWKVSCDHEVIQLNKRQDDIFSEPPLSVCERHEKKSLDFFCYNCNNLICETCIPAEHKDHRHQPLVKAAFDSKKEIVDQVKPLTTLGENLHQALKDVQATKSEIKAQGDAAIEHIKSSFTEIYKIIKSREQTLLAETTTEIGKKLKHLSVQERSLSSSKVTVQAVLGFTKKCLKSDDDGEFMHLHVDIQNRLKTAIKELDEKCLEPVEVADLKIEVNCVEKIKGLCETEAKVSRCAPKCIVTGKGIKNAEVNNVAEFRLVLMNSVHTTRRSLIVECNLKSTKTGLMKKCEVSLVQDGEYLVQYIPTVQGGHKLAITVNDQPVEGSPFPLFVSIHPTDMGREVKPAIPVEYPCGIAIDNTTDEIIVAAHKNVVVMDLSGKQLNVSDTSDYFSGQTYCGVVIDNTNDNIYATYGGTRLVKFSRALKLRNTSVHPGAQFRKLTIVGDELMVCDYNSSIKVYDKELKYVRSIGTYGTDPQQIKGSRDISSDSQGNIYVNTDKPGIHVFSNDGTFLRSFEVSFGDICGMFVTPHYIYAGGHGLHVLTLQGKQLAKMGNFYVHGVCVDKDGFAYVCDYHKKKIIIL